MDYQIDKIAVLQYLKLPKTFDWDWVDQELGFDKVFAFVPEDIYEEISQSADDDQKEIFRLLTKAAVHYAFVLDIPRMKVQISNFGVDQPNQEKMKTAPWWDVRDLGLKYLKTADQSLSKALTLISKNPTLAAQIPFFENSNPFISTPAAFQSIYSINDSPEVYLMLLPLLKRAMQIFLQAKIKPCLISDLETNPELKELLSSALAFYALYYAAEMPSFTFLNNAVVIQYEELPWQKSMILSENYRLRAGQTFLKLAEENISQIISFIKANPTDFPCYTSTDFVRPIAEARKSGLYLL